MTGVRANRVAGSWWTAFAGGGVGGLWSMGSQAAWGTRGCVGPTTATHMARGGLVATTASAASTSNAAPVGQSAPRDQPSGGRWPRRPRPEPAPTFRAIALAPSPRTRVSRTDPGTNTIAVLSGVRQAEQVDEPTRHQLQAQGRGRA